MKFGFQMLLLMSSVVLMPIDIMAQASDTQGPMSREERRAAYQSMSEEERQALREDMRSRRSEMRAQWDAMSPEERDAKRAEMRQRHKSMSPPEREAMQQRREQMRQQMREKRESMILGTVPIRGLSPTDERCSVDINCALQACPLAAIDSYCGRRLDT